MTALLLLTASLQAAPAAPAAPELSIPFETYRLDNGLQVVLSEDHRIPYVFVDVWYKVGSKDESEDLQGFAHLFEHLMFQGSEHLDGEYFAPLQEIGGDANGSTNRDHTEYYEQVPAEYLPLALWMESDRMGWLLPVLDQEKFDNQREVVLNERRQRYENRPYGDVGILLGEAVWPEGHPYHHPTIGYREDIESATLEDARDFFRRYYAPNNAILVICGDFEPGVARELVEQAFGGIPRGPEVEPPSPPPVELASEKVLRVQRDVPEPRLWIAWPTPPWLQEGDAALDLLASLLSGGKDARLDRLLVHERHLARSVSARQQSHLLGSLFVIQAVPAEGHDTDELVEAIDGVLRDLREHPPTAEEVAVGTLTYERLLVDSLQTLQARAENLAQYTFATGDPGGLAADLDRYRVLTPEDVARALDLLPLDRRVVLHVAPEDP